MEPPLHLIEFIDCTLQARVAKVKEKSSELGNFWIWTTAYMSTNYEIYVGADDCDTQTVILTNYAQSSPVRDSKFNWQDQHSPGLDFFREK